MDQCSFRRRSVAHALSFVFLLGWAGQHAFAQSAFPTKPITIVVIASGGAPDIFARLLAPRLSHKLGQPVIVEAKPGAAGNVAAAAVSRADPDGHTLLMHSALLAISPSLYKSLSFSPTKDLTPVSQIAATEMVVLVSNESPMRSLADFVRAAKAQPNKFNFASAGNGTIVHLAGEMLKGRTGTDLVHVPYKGSVPGLTALIAGEIQVTVDVMPVALPHVRSNRLRALAVTSAQRSAVLPQVPTTAEAGTPGLEVSSWNGLFVPARTPLEVIERLYAVIAEAMAEPEIRNRIAEMGAVPMATSPKQFQAFFDTEVERFGRVVKEANIKLE